MSRFTQLPPEIQEEILSTDPQLLHRSLTLSQEYSQLLSRNALRILCSKPISSAELRNYLENEQPRLFIIYNPSNSNAYPVNTGDSIVDSTATAYIYTLSEGNHWNCSTISTMVLYHDPDNIIFEQYGLMPILALKDRAINDILRDTDQSYLVDLLTTYRILRKRIGCVGINPIFAKNTVINLFSQIVSTHQNLGNPIYLFDLYCYLAAHTWIFNIDFPINDIEIEVDINHNRIPLAQSIEQPNVEALFDQIPILINLINQRLNIIDLLM